jgi:ferredoxin
VEFLCGNDAAVVVAGLKEERMKLESVELVYFSPTRTTKQVLESIAQGLDASDITAVDLTLPRPDSGDAAMLKADLVVIGAPVYAGRIPPTAMARLQSLHGQNTPVVLVAVYGNRAFEDALLELSDWAQGAGFVPVAGGAFIGEHSYHTPATPIAGGRPDAADLAKARDFAISVRSQLTRAGTVSEIGPIVLPGNRPYRELHKFDPRAPITHTDLCTLCGRCADVCPTAAITVGDAVVTVAADCILCCACVKVCPTGARVMEHAHVLQTAQWLSTEHGVRKEPEVFYG